MTVDIHYVATRILMSLVVITGIPYGIFVVGVIAVSHHYNVWSNAEIDSLLGVFIYGKLLLYCILGLYVVFGGKE